MPLIGLENIENIGTLGLWKIKESEEILLKLRQLPAKEKEEINSLKNSKKRRQRLAYRILLKEILQKDFTLSYNTQGKPFIDNETLYFSVSHSDEYAAVLLSHTHLVGVDIEKISQRMPALASRFLTPKEMNEIDLQNIDLLHIYWGAKECLYKMYSEKTPLFSKHLTLKKFDILKQNHSIAHLSMEDLKAEYRLFFRKIEDYMLVYVY
ncbi:MAG: 4'-phosphopantetheinyl transferase superfamily protein [Bacteroidales bacterium]|nr:4'-phosphopantetheinyl transferase superfamily protein [Bacteroidales bacterium]